MILITFIFFCSAILLGIKLQKSSYPKFDENIKRFFLNRKSETIRAVFLKITKLGNVETLIIISIPIVVIFLRIRDYVGISAIFNCFFTSITITHLMKFIFKRTRPHERIEGERQVGYSYPSGHSAVGVSFYTTLGYISGIGLSGFWFILSVGITIGILIALSRLYLGVHWISDVLVGSLIGIFCSYWSVYLYKLGFYYNVFK